MQKTTPNNIVQLPVAPPSLYDPAILADPDFINGFQDGIAAYEAACEDQGGKLSYLEASADIKRNLDPRVRAQSDALDQAFGYRPRPMFDAGFLAGWLYAHLFYPTTPVALPDTQPLPSVLPFHARRQAEAPSEQVSPIRYHRQMRGWSQGRLAEQLGTSEDVVSRWERGERKPSPYYCERLCAVFQVTADKLGLM